MCKSERWIIACRNISKKNWACTKKNKSVSHRSSHYTLHDSLHHHQQRNNNCKQHMNINRYSKVKLTSGEITVVIRFYIFLLKLLLIYATNK